MRRWLIALACLGGCHKLFDLEPVTDDPTGDGGTTPRDGKVNDAAVCPTPAEYDEDSDGLDDRCDRCPTVASDDADADGDGLPDACDPNQSSSGDVILLAATFGRESELGLFTPQLATWSGVGHGTVQLAAVGSLVTKEDYTPTRIDLRLQGIAPTALSGQLAIKSSALSCYVRTTNCAGDSDTATYVMIARTPPLCGELSVAATNVSQVVLSNSTPSSYCEVTAGTAGSATSGGGAAFLRGAITIDVNVYASTVVESVVIYGAK